MNKEKTYPAKVEAVYKAVIRLIGQGQDINRIKVSQIAEEAGIGKGTCYEYFSSKEEIVGEALVYDFLRNTQKMYETILQRKSFKEKYMALGDWVLTNGCTAGTYQTTWRLLGDFPKIRQAIKEMETKEQQLIQGLNQTLGHLLDQAIKEELVAQPKEILYNCGAVMGALQMLVSFHNNCIHAMDKETAKEYTYTMLIKMLQ